MVDIKGEAYSGKLMIVKDPSRLFVGYSTGSSSLRKAGQFQR